MDETSPLDQGVQTFSSFAEWINTSKSPFLAVDKAQWERQLNRSERWDNVLFFSASLLLIPLAIGLAIMGAAWILIIIVPVLLFVKNLHIRKYNRLRQHADFELMVHEDRIVRFTDRNYHILLYADVVSIRRHRFGLVLSTRLPFLQGLLRWRYEAKRDDILIIPSGVAYYSNICSYLAARSDLREKTYYL